MNIRTKVAMVVVLLVCLAISLPSLGAQTRTKIRYGLGDVLGTDDLQLLIAIERAKARGVDVEVTAFKSEELATQAVINGQVDVGQGTPYAAIPKVTIPIRFFYQLYALQFFPIVNKEFYKIWKDLDGQEIAVHARGSGTEAIMNLMAKEHGIKYKNISYVPGSDVRALGLLRGTIKASILDATNRSYVMREAPDKFLILPLGKVKASDESLFATRDFLEKNHAAVTIFVEELLRVSRQINANPKFPAEERKKLGIMKDLPAKVEAEITPYYEEAVKNEIISNDGGAGLAPKTDLEFFRLSGQLKGEDLKVEDFWHLAPLKEAITKLGK
ncbi:MAG: ABC transporter substrate-binding protein [Candidatus Eisenbacteria bacterium]|nr:ABC transporter substrate-binding protein [Candidatus Eisenbacteria bacterium]